MEVKEEIHDCESEWWPGVKDEIEETEWEWRGWEEEEAPPPPPPPPPQESGRRELSGFAGGNYTFHERYTNYTHESGKGTGDIHHAWGERRWHGWRDCKGLHKGKYKAKSKYQKPFWAFQHQMGKASNKGKVDDYGGVYTEDGYTDPTGKDWECLSFALAIFELF